MSSEIPGSRSREEKPAARPSQVVRPAALAAGAHEVRREGDHLLVTVHCPEVDEENVRYAVGRRHVVVWSHLLPRSWQHFVMLPSKVDPKTAEVHYRNGVLDVRARLAA
jgi:HSP20 family molecular chaperone IbpA